MSTEPFKGVFPYLISPVDAASGRIREGVLRDLVEHLIAQGVHGLSPLGSTGEFAYLNAEQRKEVVRIVVETARGRVPVVPGVAAYSTSDAIRQAKSFVELGADGLVVILQYYFPVTPAGVESYLRTVAESVPVPIVLYSNPMFLGGELSIDTIQRLSQVQNVQYIKDASGNAGRLLTLVNRVGDRIRVFSASIHVPLLVFLMGGVGWMGGPACLVPRQCVRLYELALEKRWDEGLALQKRLWSVNEVFFKYSLAGCVKAGLKIQGFDVGDPIPPQEPLKPEAEEEIRRILEAVKGL